MCVCERDRKGEREIICVCVCLFKNQTGLIPTVNLELRTAGDKVYFILLFYFIRPLR